MGLRDANGRPQNVMVPSSDLYTPAKIFPKVLLPAPFSPIKA